MVLRLQRRDDTRFAAYRVISGDFAIGNIQRQQASQAELWSWVIGQVNVHGDGRGPCQGGAGSREEAMSLFAGRWRIWLASAGLREIDASEEATPTVTPALALERREDVDHESYVVWSNRAALGLVGRSFGMRTDTWYWTLSSLMDRPRHGGGLTKEEALAGLAAEWSAWLVTARLQAIAPQPGDGPAITD